MVKWLVRVLAVLVVLGGVAWIYQIEILLQAVTFAMGRMDVAPPRRSPGTAAPIPRAAHPASDRPTSC